MRYRVGFVGLGLILGGFRSFWVILEDFGLFLCGLGVGLPMRYRVGFKGFGLI